MITVVPVDANKISDHFSKAEEFVFLNDDGELIKRLANPVLSAEGCKGRAKRLLVAQIAQEKPDRVVVRDLGNCMLRKLLEAGFPVYKTAASALFENLDDGLTQVTVVAHGHEPHHERDGCCGKHKHGHEHKHAHGESCGCH